jgi:hypothetical protein
MRAAAREQVRNARDRAVRVAIDWTAEPRCAGCGVEQMDPWTSAPRYVAGCRTCTDRRLRRSYRAGKQLSAQLVLTLTGKERQ